MGVGVQGCCRGPAASVCSGRLRGCSCPPLRLAAPCPTPLALLSACPAPWPHPGPRCPPCTCAQAGWWGLWAWPGCTRSTASTTSGGRTRCRWSRGCASSSSTGPTLQVGGRGAGGAGMCHCRLGCCPGGAGSWLEAGRWAGRTSTSPRWAACTAAGEAGARPPGCAAAGFGTVAALPAALGSFYTGAAAVGVLFPLFIMLAADASPKRAAERGELSGEGPERVTGRPGWPEPPRALCAAAGSKRVTPACAALAPRCSPVGHPRAAAAPTAPASLSVRQRGRQLGDREAGTCSATRRQRGVSRQLNGCATLSARNSLVAYH